MPTLIDTQKAYRRLTDSGVPETQADAIVDLFRDADDQVATQGDVERLNERLEEVEARLTQRIELSEERLGAKIEQTRTQLLQWTLGSVGAVAAIVSLLNYVMS
jgi:uncharacterized membrane protein